VCSSDLKLIMHQDQDILGYNRKISVPQLENAAPKHTMLQDSVKFAVSHKPKGFKGFISTSILAFVHYLGSKSDKKKSDLFVSQLTSGENLSRTSPIFMLRERLISEIAAVRKMSQNTKLALTIKAWNAFLKDARIKLLKWSPETEKFPVIEN
jgi:hypothetical protein